MILLQCILIIPLCSAACFLLPCSFFLLQWWFSPVWINHLSSFSSYVFCWIWGCGCGWWESSSNLSWTHCFSATCRALWLKPCKSHMANFWHVWEQETNHSRAVTVVCVCSNKVQRWLCNYVKFLAFLLIFCWLRGEMKIPLCPDKCLPFQRGRCWCLTTQGFSQSYACSIFWEFLHF